MRKIKNDGRSGKKSYRNNNGNSNRKKLLLFSHNFGEDCFGSKSGLSIFFLPPQKLIQSFDDDVGNGGAVFDGVFIRALSQPAGQVDRDLLGFVGTRDGILTFVHGYSCTGCVYKGIVKIIVRTVQCHNQRKIPQ